MYAMTSKENNTWHGLSLNTIYNMDCIEWMKMIPDWSIDCIITDPPYWMNYVSSRRNIKHKKIIWDDAVDMQELFNKSYKVLKNNSHIYCFCNEYCIWPFRQQLINSWFNIKRMLVWKKNNHTSWDLLWDYANQTEYILFAHKWRRLLNWWRDRNVLEYNRVNTDKHPTAKPVDIIEYFINKSSNELDIILDPFMWSWTTAVACLNTNRSFIWFELDKWYREIANKRIWNLDNIS